jgi:acrylyl-CoA reductase (NADPH)
VMPFILRGVRLLGINSGSFSNDVRGTVWQRLATDLKPPLLKEMCRTIPFSQLPGVFNDFIDAKITRRIVVDLSD